MIAHDVRKNVLTGQADRCEGSGSAGIDETGRSGSEPNAGAAPSRRARNGLSTVPSLAPLPPYVPLDLFTPKTAQKEPELTITDEQLFEIQKMVAFVTQQWEARSNVSKVTHDSAMNAISNIK